MLKKIGLIGCLTTAVLGFASFPVQAETNNSQDGDQSVEIDGNNNQVIQIIEQTIIEHPGRGSQRRNNRDNSHNSSANENSSSQRRENSGNAYGHNNGKKKGFDR